MGVKENVRKLSELLVFITKENKGLAKEVIALYKARVIKTIGQVEKLLRRLTNNNKQGRGYVLRRLETYYKASKKDSKLYKYSLGLLLFKKIDPKDDEAVEEAKEVAKAKGTKYHKGYLQYHAGDHILDIPNLAISNGQIRAISPDFLNTFF